MESSTSNSGVSDVLQRLQQYRAKKQAEAEQIERLRAEAEVVKEEPTAPVEPQFNFLENWALDVLDIYPLRLCRRFKDAYPMQFWIMAVSVWLVGQLLAIHIQFGLVFLLMSFFLLLFLNLGIRAEGEMSAYSVFNPGCERLLGQITAEHFERDMMMQRQG